MNPRTTGILFLIAAALGAFVYFYEIRGEEGRREAEQREKQLFPGVDADQIESVELTSKDGTPVRIERREEGWEITEPLVFPADRFVADAIASGLAELSSEAVLEKPQPPEVYGLDDEDREVRFTAAGEEHALRIGDKTPMGSNSYARTGASESIVTVRTSATLALSKSFDDLREKRILSFDRSNIDRIEASWPEGGVVLELRDGEWRLVEPIEGRADRVTVDALLSDLSFLRASGFVDDAPPDDRVGLDLPAFAVKLTGAAEGGAGEPLEQSLEIGRNPEDGSLLVRGARPSLYRIREERLDDFPRELVAYRFKQLAEFAPSDAGRVDLTFFPRVSTEEGEGSVTIRATRGETGWSSSPESIEPTRISRMVSELSRLRAEGILADAVGPNELDELGLSPPSVILSVFGEDPDEPLLAQVQIGLFRGEEGIVARAAQGETVFLLGDEFAEYIPVSLEAFRNRFVSQEEPAEEAEVEEIPLEAEDFLTPAEESP